jgi:hypothetical protein
LSPGYISKGGNIDKLELNTSKRLKKSKTIPVTGCGGS